MKCPALESMAAVLGYKFLTLETFASKRPLVFSNLSFENNQLMYKGARYKLKLSVLSAKVAQIEVDAFGTTNFYVLSPFHAERMFSDLAMCCVPEKPSLMQGILLRNQAQQVQASTQVS